MSVHPELRPVAIVGMSAIMPQAPDAEAFWGNISGGRYCITDVPPERWDPELYYDPDPAAPDKTYTRIGGWVREFPWDPLTWKLPVPPRVAAQMDGAQKWSVSAARSALLDAGWPDWNVDPERVAVIIGNAIGGEQHYRTCLRIESPEFLKCLQTAPALQALPEEVRTAIVTQTRESFLSSLPPITEDTMPGELANIIAGRVANLFNFRGPNFTTDAACASGLAALTAACNGLRDGHYDVAITGGVDRNMGIGPFVKFCKIGALSATGTRPFDAGADGFVMGEGAALFVLKRLADAERDGDRIYAVVLGIGGSSDGRGKGITAPNPIGQKLAVERAWRNAEVDPAEVGLVEAHGTSTRAGDASELASLTEVFGKSGALPGSIALGSVKSNIGHLKAAAGAAGLFKMARSLHEKLLPPSLHFDDPNPNVDWSAVPFRVNTELRPWDDPAGGIRRGGVSAFGFGGTNFHIALEEHVPGRYPRNGQRSVSISMSTGTEANAGSSTAPATTAPATAVTAKAPLRGALVVGGRDEADVLAQLRHHLAEAEAGRAAAPSAPDPALKDAALRVAVDYADAADLAGKLGKTVKAFTAGNPAMFRMLRSQGVFVGRGPAPRVAFLYTGQGSQYVNMLAELRRAEPIVAETFAEADVVMTPLLGRPLTSYIFIDADDPKAVAQLEQQLLQTEITQPAVLATDLALTRLLAAYGIGPDMVMGHSLGEYGALMVAGSLTFEAALEAVSCRGHEMASLNMGDNGAMAAVFGPLTEIERAVAEARDYVVVANINSNNQAVVGGSTEGVQETMERLESRGINAIRIPVSHAFHTSIVAPASEPLKVALRRLDVTGPKLPTVANVTGEFYPEDAGVETMLDILGKQVASPVQFVKGLHSLYEAGARLFVEIGPKKALAGFVDDVLGSEHDDVASLFTNHPKLGDITSFNQALCGMYAAGLGLRPPAVQEGPVPDAAAASATAPTAAAAVAPARTTAVIQTSTSEGATMSATPSVPAGMPSPDPGTARFAELGRLFAGVLEQGLRLYGGSAPTPAPGPGTFGPAGAPVGAQPVVITGASLGLPGVERTFDDENVARILAGQQFIDIIPSRFRQRMADMHITRLVKDEEAGAAFETIDSQADVIKLAGRHAPLDVVKEFGVDAARDAALDNTTRMAIGAGFDALRDAGIPLVMHYKTTTLGTQLPDRWGLPDALRDDTGVIFASAFPGYDNFAADIEAYLTDRGRREQLLALEAVRSRMRGDEPAVAEVDRRVAELRHLLQTEPHTLDRRFLFRVLSMGHSQFAEIIGARGPNTQVNAACASTTQAIGLAQDWIRAGRCRRVIVVSADDATADHLLPWIAGGFLATGAAATDDVVEDAATPFDRRRHGMIVGAGAASVVVESAEAARERGIQPICEVLGCVIANSAFHGTRLDVDHIGQVMETLLRQAESRGVRPDAIAGSTVFVSHETYTPARGGSAAAEINALRRNFGRLADDVVITNTKGFTGHAMGAGIEDVVAIKALETGIVPQVPNYKEPDPELGRLNLSQGGAYPVTHALRLAAGFGSQIAMSLLRWTPVPDGRHRSPAELGYAYRVVDPQAWQRWLDLLSGHPASTLEVSQRRLRIVDTGPAARTSRVVPSAAATTQAAPTTGTSPVAPAAVVPAPVPATRAPAPEPATPPAPLVPAAPPAPAPATAPAVAAAAPARDPVVGEVVGMVSEMTGYPPELLDLDLDLEADLGVDTVKQAEVFAAVRERWDIPRQDDLRLRDFPTLNHVIGWVREKTGITATAQAAAPAAQAGTVAAEPVPGWTGTSAPTPQTVAPAPQPAQAAGDPVIDEVVQIVSDMTGYPPELLDLDLDLEADLGVDTVKQAEVFAAVRERWDIPRQDDLRLRDFPTLNHVIGWVREKTGITATGITAGQPVTVTTTEADVNLEAVTPPTTTDGAAPAAPAAPAPAAPAPAAADPVIDEVVRIVSDMTGYPPELLDLDLDLEADLGVDTVKQAEVFAAVRERWDIPRQENLQLRDFPTLNHVIGWVREKTGITAAAATAPATAAAATTPATATALATAATEPAATASAPESAAGQAVAAPKQDGAPKVSVTRGDLTAIDRLPRRIPVPMLRPDLSRCTPTGVRLDEGTRVVVMLDEGGVGAALVKKLRKRGVDVVDLEPGTGTERIIAALDTALTRGAVHGVFWLAALDDEGPLENLNPEYWHETLRRRVKRLYATMRRLYDGSPFLVTGTRLGGYHGYDDAGATAPLGGAVTGFAKSYRRERPDALVKAVDFPADRRTAAIADLLIEETLRDPGCVEVGVVDGRRWGVGLVERPFPALAAEGHPDGEGGLRLTPDSVVVVTGAAGSIVSAITADLAAASGGTFHLLDLTPAPDPQDPDLRLFLQSRDGLKTVLMDRLKAAGQRPTPVAIDKELARFERLQMALAAIQAVEQAGGTAHYHCVDLTDAEAVAGVMRAVRETSGRIDVLLHAAGLEISRDLPDKQPREYDLVFDVKSDGFFNVLQGAGDLPIGATVVFSSVAGRFGNAGQTDYSAANDLLCKITSSFRRTRPDTRGLALDWTAWGTIGMATRGSIPKIMEMAGVQLLPAEAGVAWIRRELTSSPFRGEVVVAGELGLMAAQFHPTGGLDVAAVPVHGCGPMVGEVQKLSVHDGIVVTTTLDPTAQPFLDHHRIDGTAVLPGVMGMEGFAEAAALLAPDRRVAGLEDVTFASPVKFYRDEPRTLMISALLHPDGEDLVADCRLSAQRVLPGSDVPQTTVHFTGRVRLTPTKSAGAERAAAADGGTTNRRSPDGGTPDGGTPDGAAGDRHVLPGNGFAQLGHDDVYRLYFHGPAYQVVSAVWRDGPDAIARLADELGPDHRPEDAPLLIGPRLVELCFQDAGLWEAGNAGRLALPMHVDRLRLLADPAAAPQGPVHATARPAAGHDTGEVFDCAVVDGAGRVLLRMDGYATVPLPAPIEGELGARLHEVLGLQEVIEVGDPQEAHAAH